MWTCPRCGEPHEDHFSDCWKCAGEELQTAVAPPLPAQTTERPLRPFSAILLRAFIGFCVGAVLTMLLSNFINLQAIIPELPEASLERSSVLALIAGLTTGAVVGVMVWVVFPYEAKK